MKKILLAVAVVAIFFFGACAKKEELKVLPQYEITTVSQSVLYVVAHADDTMDEPKVGFVGRSVDFWGYGRALASALNQIGQQHEIKHVTPVGYGFNPGMNNGFGVTKALIVIIEPKK